MAMRKPGGYGILIDGNTGKVRETDSFTCNHCQQIMLVGGGKKAEDCGGWCTICAKLICPKCVGKQCDPFEEKLRRHYAKHDALRSYGLV